MPFAEIARFLVRGLKARFRDQKCEFDVIRRHVGPGDLVCDVGANKGSFVWWLSRWCRDGRVIAFEPQPAFAARLAAVCRSLLPLRVGQNPMRNDFLTTPGWND